MAQHALAHFHNSAGLAVLEVNAREFMCIGALPPYDHPHVYLDMGAESEILCPYCSTLFRYTPSLKPGASNPPDALWHVD